jgi:hypothetical protein
MPLRIVIPEVPPVADLPVAPHRYRYDAPLSPDPTSYKEAKAAAPYKAGEVVYVAYGDGYAKALIDYVTARLDRFDDPKEAYIVRRETKAGLWSKRAYLTYPGIIQRGYYRAGLAPEIPADEMI